jgi:hypothetical protein
VRSPFAKVISLGFYDGPTSGVLQCETCSANHKFDMLDWDEQQEVRIFRLAQLPSGSLDRCVRVYADIGSPRWPLWVPSVESSSPETRDAVNRTVQQVLDSAEPATVVMAWVPSADMILSATRVPAEDLSNAPDWFSADEPAITHDWFARLGLPKKITAGKL